MSFLSMVNVSLALNELPSYTTVTCRWILLNWTHIWHL